MTLRTMPIWTAGMITNLSSVSLIFPLPFSPVHAPQHDVDRPDQGHDVRDEVAAGQIGKRLKIDEAGGAESAAPGRVRTVAHQIDPLLPPGPLGHVVHLSPSGGFEPLRDLRAHVAGR